MYGIHINDFYCHLFNSCPQFLQKGLEKMIWKSFFICFCIAITTSSGSTGQNNNGFLGYKHVHRNWNSGCATASQPNPTPIKSKSVQSLESCYEFCRDTENCAYFEVSEPVASYAKFCDLHRTGIAGDSYSDDDEMEMMGASLDCYKMEGNGCQFIEVTGSDRNVNGIYLRSNATRRSSFDDPEWKLSSRDQSRTRYIYKSGSGFSKKWAIGTERDKDMAFSNRYYAYKDVGNTYVRNTSLPLRSKRWKSKNGQKSVNVQCRKCCNTLRTTYSYTITQPNPISEQFERFGQYNMESTLVNGRPHYTSKRDNGAYAIWYAGGNFQRWMVGPSNMRGREFGYLYIDDRNSTMCPDQIVPRNGWFYHNHNKNWSPAHQDFSLSCE